MAVFSSVPTADGASVVTVAAVLPPTGKAAQQAESAMARLKVAPGQELPLGGPVCVLASAQRAAQFVPLSFAVTLAEAADEAQLEGSLQRAMPAGTLLTIGSLAASADGTLAASVRAEVPAYQLAGAEQACQQVQQEYERRAAEVAACKQAAERAAWQEENMEAAHTKATSTTADQSAPMVHAEDQVSATGVPQQSPAAEASTSAAPVTAVSFIASSPLVAAGAAAAGNTPAQPPRQEVIVTRSSPAPEGASSMAAPSAAATLAVAGIVAAGAREPPAAAALSAQPATVSGKKSGNLFSRLFRSKKAAAVAEVVPASPAVRGTALSSAVEHVAAAPAAAAAAGSAAALVGAAASSTSPAASPQPTAPPTIEAEVAVNQPAVVSPTAPPAQSGTQPSSNAVAPAAAAAAVAAAAAASSVAVAREEADELRLATSLEVVSLVGPAAGAAAPAVDPNPQPSSAGLAAAGAPQLPASEVQSAGGWADGLPTLQGVDALTDGVHGLQLSEEQQHSQEVRVPRAGSSLKRSWKQGGNPSRAARQQQVVHGTVIDFAA